MESRRDEEDAEDAEEGNDAEDEKDVEDVEDVEDVSAAELCAPALHLHGELLSTERLLLPLLLLRFASNAYTPWRHPAWSVC